MPVKASQFDLVNRRDVADTHQVVAVDPANYNLTRIPASQFRGASNFTSFNAPTIVPENPAYTQYIAGDTYQHFTSEGVVQYRWDNVNSRWTDATKLNGTRVLTAKDFPEEINLDLRLTNFLTDSAFSDDYYLNKTLSLLFSYSATQGFKFGTTDFTGYQAFRAPTVFEYQGNDVDGYTDPKHYLLDYDINNRGTDAEIRARYLPIFNDTFHLKLEGDEGHGGWVWYFKPDRTVTNSSQVYDNFNEKFGVDPAGTDTTNRYHFREAKTWNETTTPAQNDKKYRQGDNVFVTTRGILYYNYQEGLPAGTTDLSVLFEGQTILAGKDLKTAQDTDGNWIDPTANDSLYQGGDYIFTKTMGTPRIHGPYQFGAGSDLEAWPLYAVLRSPIKHVYPDGTTLPVSYAGDYPTHPDGYMIVSGDDLHVFYSGEKTYVYEGAADVRYGETSPEKIINWNTGSRRAFHQIAIKTSASTAEPSVDNSVYYDGQFVRNANGDIYKYIEDFVGTNHSFELQGGLRANVIHKQTVASNFTDVFVPDTAQNSADWGGATVQDGDTLEVSWDGSATNKTLVYDAEVNEALNTVQWKNERSKFGNRTFEVNFNVPPAAYGNDLYWQDDVIVTKSGYKYLINKPTDATGISFSGLGWIRSPRVFLFAATLPYIPSREFEAGVPDGSWDFSGTISTMIGDKVVVSVTGSSTGKQIAYDVIAEDKLDSDLSPQYNPNPVKFHVTNEVGRPNLNDNEYSAGDFIDSSTTGWRYGPYVEGQVDNADAWPDFVKLTQTTEYTDKTTAVKHEIEVDNGEFYFLEK